MPIEDRPALVLGDSWAALSADPFEARWIAAGGGPVTRLTQGGSSVLPNEWLTWSWLDHIDLVQSAMVPGMVVWLSLGAIDQMAQIVFGHPSPPAQSRGIRSLVTKILETPYTTVLHVGYNVEIPDPPFGRIHPLYRPSRYEKIVLRHMDGEAPEKPVFINPSDPTGLHLLPSHYAMRVGEVFKRSRLLA